MSEIRVENIIGETGNDAVKFTKGINVTGVTTATSFSGSGANLTSLPAANLTGTLPAISGANLTNVSAGKLLQVVQGYDTNFVRASTSSNTYVATDHAVTITPTAANSKILISFNGDANTNGNNNYIQITVQRSVNGGSYSDISQLGQSGGNGNGFMIVNGAGQRIEVPFCINFLDSPSYSLGNAIVYKLYFKGSGSSLEIPSSSSNQPVIGIAREISA